MKEKTEAWVARDESGSLFIYEEKPIKHEHSWKPSISFNDCYSLNNHFNLPQVKWEDEEPTKVELTIKISK